MNSEPTLEPISFHIPRCSGFPSFREDSRAFVLLLLLLWWLPQSTKGQGATFADRKIEILTAIVNTGLPTKATDPTRVGDAMLQKATAHFGLGQNAEGVAMVDSALNDGTGAMFYFYMLMYNYLKYGDHMDQALKDRIKTKITSYGGGINGSTQNHSLMYATAFTLARETWPDATFAHPLGYGSNDPSGKQMIIDGMKTYTTKGCEEADSYFYTVFYVNCYAMIAEFSKDKAFANMAKLTCDWFLLGAANNWLNGYMISPDNRTADNYWGVNECPQDPGMSSVCYYLYFGSDRPFSLKPDSTPLTKGTVGGSHSLRKAALNCVSTYQCPEEIIRIARDRKTPFLLKETHLKDSHMGMRRGLYRSSYIAPTWGITGQKDVSFGDYYQKQILRWFVRWVSDEPYSTFNLFMPNAERKLEELFGRTKYEQIMHHNRTVVGVTRAPSDYKHPFVYALIPKAAIKSTAEESGWLFIDAGPVMIAVKFARPYVWQDDFELFRSIRSDNPINGYIVETADATSYPGASPSARFAAFKRDILTKTTPDFSKLDTDPKAPSVSFKNLDGDQMTITFSEERDENHVLNGKKVDYYSTWPLIDSPWAHQGEGKPILKLKVDGSETTYNFEAWHKHSGERKADLHVIKVTPSVETPSVKQATTFTAIIKNSGSTPSVACRVKFLVGKPDSNKSPLEDGNLPVIEPGATASVTSSAYFPESGGLHMVAVEVDSGGQVDEIEESNNHEAEPFAVEQLDIALERPVVSSSGNARLANDKDPHTFWQSKELPGSITVDLGEMVAVQQVKLAVPPAWATPRVMTVEVLTSADGDTFQQTLPPKSYSARGNAPAIIELNGANARHLRLSITTASPNNYAEIARLQVHGATVAGAK